MAYLEDMISTDELNTIINMYTIEKKSLRTIEKETHHGRNAISNMFKRLNIQLDETRFHPKKYTFNYNFFEKIDNELAAYWLGFMYADGCVLPRDCRGYGEQEFQLQLAIQDLEILEKFKEDLQSTYPITYDKSKHLKNINSQVMARCKYRSQKTVEDLKKLGCIEKKSLILQFPTEEQVPSSLINHFIRGYFDGDGSISSTRYKNYQAYNISFVGTQDFINKLSNILNIGSVCPDKRKTNSWYLNIGGNQQVLQIYHYLYDDAHRYLQRKYDKFMELVNKYNES